MELQTMPLRFRVWCVSKGDFITLQDVFFPQEIRKDKRNETELNLRWFCRFIAKETSMMALDNDEYIISQDTGFKDKNGKSIYTGDIVEDDCMRGVMEYGYGVLGIRTDPHGQSATTWIDLDCIEGDLTVVGNIWQNLNLMKEKND